MREWLGIFMLFFQAILILPLAVELIRSRSGDGVSLLGETLWVTAGMGWIAYGVLTNSWVLMASGTLAFLGSALVSMLVWRYKQQQEKSRAILYALVVGLIFLMSIIIWGAIGISVTLSIFGVIQFLPQAVTSWKALRNGGVPGVPIVGSISRSAYTLTWAVYAGAWFLWGLSFSEIDYPLLTWGIAGCIVFGMQGMTGILYRLNGSEDVHSVRKVHQ